MNEALLFLARGITLLHRENMTIMEKIGVDDNVITNYWDSMKDIIDTSFADGKVANNTHEGKTR